MDESGSVGYESQYDTMFGGRGTGTPRALGPAWYPGPSGETQETTMASTTASADLAASPDRVWGLIGGFGSLPDWLPSITGGELLEGGRVRRVTTKDGVVIVERLQHFDERGRTYGYSAPEPPLPVRDYRATIAVHEVPGEPERSRVEWTGCFTPEGVTEEEAVAVVHRVLSGGLDALRRTLGA
ncbi:SRPBCC family protein [Herbidospora yilanensis]|uniref:SRPBCC family protein n=1 Tax=Herbidospora yilanensis TaxID=354426 RepID=UPI000A4D35CD|nr:SRPBCC family protein [Herbidospora yilanensis]